jgi:NAD(P)-dependent dehydrogenase (short-subunit alcohol dehydrogenase family)
VARSGGGALPLLRQGISGAVVTGGAGGLGSALGAALSALGFRVRLADVDEDAARYEAASIGGAATAVALDVSDDDACRELAEQVEAEDGLSLWVNNAGVLRTRPSWEHPAAEVRLMFDVNVYGTMHGTWAALDVMRRRGRGLVVNIVSLAGLASPQGETVYAATKHAALAFTTGTLQDLRGAGFGDIAVSAVCPDGIWTPMLYDKVDDPNAAPSWSGVLLQPDQVAARVVDVVRSPRPVVSVPGWRGAVARLYSAMPRGALAARPALHAVARRKQQAFARRQRAAQRD